MGSRRNSPFRFLAFAGITFYKKHIMNEKRLMERLLSDPDDSREKSSSINTDILLSSIKKHLVRILNTRQGSVLIDENYGIPDFSKLPGNFDSPETEAMRNYISAMVEKYEPRLKVAHVVFEGKKNNDFSLRFGLSGEIVDKGVRTPVNIGASFSSLNRFRIN